MARCFAVALLAVTACGFAGGRSETVTAVEPIARLSAGPLPFALQFRGERSDRALITTTALPGESFEIEAEGSGPGARFEATAERGELRRLGPGRWRFTAPDAPGTHLCVDVSQQPSGATACLQVLVMLPYLGEEFVNGYRIGRYRRMPLPGHPAYARPRGLVEVTPENRDLPVSPHFRLGEFLAKQKADWPRYLVLRTRLLLLLETLLDELRESGIPSTSLVLMSAYRSPFYSASIGNQTVFSRHAYGDAVDLFVDADGDGRMDDLDGDGAIGAGDARWLYDLLDGLENEAIPAHFAGGLSVYGPKPHRGPFVHVDTRGRRARW